MILNNYVRVSERLMFVIITILELIGCALLYFWRSSLDIGATRYSIWIYAASFLGGIAGTLVLVCFAYVSRYAGADTTAFSTGLGFAGLEAALVAELQSIGVSDSNVDGLFSVEVFITITIALVVTSMLSFVAIERHKVEWSEKRIDKIELNLFQDNINSSNDESSNDDDDDENDKHNATKKRRRISNDFENNNNDTIKLLENDIDQNNNNSNDDDSSSSDNDNHNNENDEDQKQQPLLSTTTSTTTTTLNNSLSWKEFAKIFHSPILHMFGVSRFYLIFEKINKC
jgi:hypothetical protein